MAASLIKKPNSISSELHITSSYLDILDTQNINYVRQPPKKEQTKTWGKQLKLDKY